MKSFSRALFDYLERLRRSGLRFLQNHAPLAFTIILCAVIAATSVVFRIAEHDTHEAIWRSIVYLMSGMDIDPPTTEIGKFAAGVALLCGIVFVSLLTGYIAAGFSQMLQRSRAIPVKGSRRVLENHVILFGWNRKTREVLAELNADSLTQGFRADDYIVVSEQPLLDRPAERIYRNVWHVQGRASESLRKADLLPVKGRGRGARVATIIADPALPRDEADRRSLLTLLAVENLYPEVISIAEVVDPLNQEHFENAYADEVVLPTHFANMLLARTAVFPGVASYIDELLSLRPQPVSGKMRRPISFYTLSAADLDLTGQSLKQAVVEQYLKNRALIVGIVGKDQVQFIPDIADSDRRLLVATDHLVAIGRPGSGGGI